MVDHHLRHSAAPTATAGASPRVREGGTGRRARGIALARGDRLALLLLVGLPLVLHVGLVWLPTLASVGLSFTSWTGVGGLDAIEPVGLRNYEQLLGGYPPFATALRNNVLWFAVFVLVATPVGVLFAVLLDRELRGRAFYRSALYLPVVLSLAVVGFIWRLQYAPEQGFLNNALGLTDDGRAIDWLGNPDLNIWAVIVAAAWRHVGYVMILYLAGLRAMDPRLREAAAIDGAGERQTFLRVTLPVLAPVNVVVLVVTAIEAIRAFDLVWVINRGTNGLEVLAVLVTNAILGEAGRVGFGSAIATVMLVLCVGPILLYLRRFVGRGWA
jgi:multiple sugar transport system permease protein